MLKPLGRGRGFGLLVLLGLATGAAQCDCDTAQNCVLDEECAGMLWTEDCLGHWECVEGSCVPICDQQPECEEHADCVGMDWPLDDPSLDCTQATGHWECEIPICVAYCNEECNSVADCVLRAWPETCQGRWACSLGRCRAECDPTGCGNDTCDAAEGETVDSCEADCLEGCSQVSECLDRPWTLPCEGVWTCVAEVCAGACDYHQCGDGTCDAAAGEDVGGCPSDCLQGCRNLADCTTGTWNQLCQGHWNCFASACQQVCDSVRCGDGVCLPGQGESGGSCNQDCGEGGCSGAVDCAAYAWPEACGGHWSCTAGGACQAECAASCGDGACDVPGGETPDSCAADCVDHACEVSADCAALTLPAGCSGEFQCVLRVCRPICG